MASDHRGFYKIQGNKALGFIKVGRKKLFLRVCCPLLCVCMLWVYIPRPLIILQNAVGAIKEIKPVCVLDFYVHEVGSRDVAWRIYSTFRYPHASGSLSVEICVHICEHIHAGSQLPVMCEFFSLYCTKWLRVALVAISNALFM